MFRKKNKRKRSKKKLTWKQIFRRILLLLLFLGIGYYFLIPRLKKDGYGIKIMYSQPDSSISEEERDLEIFCESLFYGKQSPISKAISKARGIGINFVAPDTLIDAHVKIDSVNFIEDNGRYLLEVCIQYFKDSYKEKLITSNIWQKVDTDTASVDIDVDKVDLDIDYSIRYVENETDCFLLVANQIIEIAKKSQPNTFPLNFY